MPPILKDPETAIASAVVPSVSGALAAKVSGESTGKPQPVALEIPVTVNGARAVGGSEKREPFSETTKTVLVFGNGAVIRLSAMVAPGQLIFLTNEKSKKEVVCQVVKSKNYKTVTGYVELEFTEAAAGFWGMRFPAAATAPRPVTSTAVAPPPPVTPKIETPIASPVNVAPPELATAKPMAAGLTIPDVRPEVEIRKEEILVAVQETEAKVEAPAPAATTLDAMPFSTFSSTGGKVVAPQNTAVASPASLPSSPSSKELKQQAVRLQEQLGAMLFTDGSRTKTSALADEKVEGLHPGSEAKLFELLEAKVIPQAQLASHSTTSEVKPLATSLDAEEMKIPSWLAPLARATETAATHSMHEVEAKAVGEPSASMEETSADVLIPLAEEVTEKVQPVMFGGQLLVDSAANAGETGGSGSKKGLFFGIAASLLLLGGGGYWYTHQGIEGIAVSASSRRTLTQSVEPTNAPASSVAPSTESTLVTSAANPSAIPAVTTSSSSASVGQSARAASPFTPSASPARNSAPALNESVAPAEAKKPVLGQVRLANPVVGRAKSGADNNELAPAIEGNQPVVGGDALGGLAATHGKQPVAPLLVGGDVKQALLIKSVPPAYPNVARAQRVSGDVKMDALIDALGNVTSTKVLSGPTLLHQAAMDAVKQWKYRPAELDGKATAMHLTVVVQFRLQ